MKKVLLFVLAALVMVACNEKPEGELTSATLSRTTLDLVEGATFRLVVKPTPDDADFTATWSSSDEMVASVSSNGTVSANSIGTATISAAIEGTDIVATCQVTVEATLATVSQFTSVCQKMSGIFLFSSSFKIFPTHQSCIE